MNGMRVVYTNQTSNYKRHLARNIRQLVNGMTDERKQKLLDDIHLKRCVCSLNNQNYNKEVSEYIESLLQDKRPKNGLSQRKEAK